MERAITLKPPKSISAKVADRDNPPWAEEMLGPPVMRRGRGPQKAPTKVLTTLRLDADVIAFFRAQGPGYQSRINEALRRVKKRGLTGSTTTARKRAAR
ncbi:MAG: BrnA antitoxin family protein [Betaproteobacteria bacterium]|nr:BrnA antitoxin family protein [Betaproteobacteria bacterium]